MRAHNTVISLVEKGWAGARQISLELAREGIVVCHLVKGRLPRELLRVLSSHAELHLKGAPPRLFKTIAWSVLAGSQFNGAARLVLVDNERTLHWVGRWFPRLRNRLVLVREQPDGSPVMFRSEERVELGALLAELRT